MTYKGHLKCLQITKNFKTGYKKMIIYPKQFSFVHNFTKIKKIDLNRDLNQ